VWLFDDLVGNILDDSYYMFTLQNTIPYLPIVIYQDAAQTIPWSDPIQFNANGTLPINMYWDENTVYRLEIRNGNTQDATLTYLIENYVPISGGSAPVTSGTNDTTNQITNPQFAVVNFTGTLTSTASSLLNVAPGWDIVTTGNGPGSISVTQLQVEGVSGDSTNPSFALQIMSSGWDTVGIQQTFEENGALWASGINDVSGVALEISAYNSSGTAPPLSGIISYTGTDAPGPTTIFTAASINAAPNSYGGAAALPISANTSLPASAATAVSFVWTSNNTVVVTSVQLIGQQGEDIAEVAYQQESIERQIDHFYHVAYPITPVGTIIDFGGFGIPTHYLFCDGTAYSRTIYSQLFSALTTTMTVSLTSTMTTFTVTSSISLYIGMAIEGNGIPASTTISNISGTTITMSAAATATVTSVVTFFAWGDGNGSTTFNVPDLRGYVTAGSQGSLFTSNGAGNEGGSSTHMIGLNEMPQHTHNPLSPATGFYENQTTAGGTNSGLGNITNTSTTGGITSYSTQTALSLVQQTALVNKFIRFE
jgi:microcystin-dependent protein